MKIITLAQNTFDEIMRCYNWAKKYSNNFTKGPDAVSSSSTATEYQGTEWFVGFIRENRPDDSSQYGGGQIGIYAVESCVNIGAGSGDISSWQRHEDDDPKRKVCFALNLAESNEVFPTRKLLPGTRVIVFKTRSSYGREAYVFYATAEQNGAAGYQLVDQVSTDDRWRRDDATGIDDKDWKYKDRGEIVATEIPAGAPQTKWLFNRFVSKFSAADGTNPAKFYYYNLYADNLGRIEDVYKDSSATPIGNYTTVVTDVRWTGTTIEKKTRSVCLLYVGTESGWT